MDRRNFLKTGALTLGAAAFATETISAAGKETDALAKCKAVEAKVPSEGYVKESSRRIPLIATADVAVVGGGPAGVAAAVSAARSGASVILLEKNWFLGGLWTGGLVLPVIDHEGAAPDGSVVTTLTGFGMEVCGRLREMGMIVRNGAHQTGFEN